MKVKHTELAFVGVPQQPRMEVGVHHGHSSFDQCSDPCWIDDGSKLYTWTSISKHINCRGMLCSLIHEINIHLTVSSIDQALMLIARAIEGFSTAMNHVCMYLAFCQLSKHHSHPNGAWSMCSWVGGGLHPVDHQAGGSVGADWASVPLFVREVSHGHERWGHLVLILNAGCPWLAWGQFFLQLNIPSCLFSWGLSFILLASHSWLLVMN